ncbi:MAG: hypothetical protein Faunusvirus1_25 [Faunusvirus sp.]|jgi:ankyrin repeat protein|uniref:Uncharacterized protein n=1 Tax=Faunusvirus sp. TaxID=2487766 RepID=A0A3G4ZVT3_9VIRU|nr:MAG: hypothetical protein Faunusvirus1_25 [Faunusvirus sp.]
MDKVNNAASAFDNLINDRNEDKCINYVKSDKFKYIRYGNLGFENTMGCYLYAICSAKFSRLALMVIEQGANIDVVNIHGQTPLMSACAYGLEDVAIKLINNKCNIAAQDKYGYAAITFACISNMTSIIMLLVDLHMLIGSDMSKLIYSLNRADMINKYVYDKYHTTILSAIDDVDSVIGGCFVKTYAIGVVGIICEFIVSKIEK